MIVLGSCPIALVNFALYSSKTGRRASVLVVVVCKVIFMSDPTFVELCYVILDLFWGCGWGFDKKKESFAFIGIFIGVENFVSLFLFLFSSQKVHLFQRPFPI